MSPPSERYVVLGLARPRAPWFAEITRWATAAVLPVEFVKCLTAEEARARLASGRRWSAVLVDGAAHGVDRDLIEAASVVGARTMVVADPRVDRDWRELGAVAVLPADLERDRLLAALAEHARPVARSLPLPDHQGVATAPPWRGRLVAVTGIGGAGASVIAAMTAQGIGTDVREHGLVLLADLALHADQAVLHDAGDVVPGVPELVDAHRLGRPEVDEIRAMTFDGGRERSYDLLLGLRRHQDWTALRPRAVDASLDGLRRAYRTVVADVDADVEGERETGSPDVEERNLLARAALSSADVVLVVGRPDVVGVHRVGSLLRELLRFGVVAERVAPVINRAPRSPRVRAELSATMARLAGPDGADLASTTFVGERRRLDDTIRDGGEWPAAVCRQLASTVDAVLARDQPPAGANAPERVVPGSLGTYADLDAESDAS